MPVRVRMGNDPTLGRELLRSENGPRFGKSGERSDKGVRKNFAPPVLDPNKSGEECVFSSTGGGSIKWGGKGEKRGPRRFPQKFFERGAPRGIHMERHGVIRTVHTAIKSEIQQGADKKN